MSNEEKFVPPEHLLSDYVEIAYLLCLIVVGIPLNVYFLKRLLIQYRSSKRDAVKAGFMLLKINLTISDLLLLVMAFGKLVWLCTYQWPGGDLLCRVYQFLSMFSFYISSNIVVCIALDRLRNVLAANRIHSTHKWNAVTVMVSVSWTFAVLCSWPQLFVFTSIDVSANEGWFQCTDIWQVNRAFPQNASWLYSEWIENAYGVSHLIIVFWGPLLIMLACYAVIATRLIQYSQRSSPGVKCNLASHPIAVDGSAPVTTTTDTPNVRKTTEVSLTAPTRHSFFSKCRRSTTSEFTEREPLATRNNSQKRRSSPVLATLQTDTRPCWRRQLRSKVFRSTLLLVLAHFLLWFPYNLMAIMKYIDTGYYENLSKHANFFKDMQLIIALINGFCY